MLLLIFAGWVNRHQLDVIEYLQEENRVLKERLGGRRGAHMVNLWNSRGSMRNFLLPLVSCCECIHSVLNALGKDGSAFYRCR
jgi:hypothetical protein